MTTAIPDKPAALSKTLAEAVTAWERAAGGGEFDAGMARIVALVNEGAGTFSPDELAGQFALFVAAGTGVEVGDRFMREQLAYLAEKGAGFDTHKALGIALAHWEHY